MPRYYFKAKTKEGAIKEGIIDASNINEASHLLQEQELVLLEIDFKQSTASKKEFSFPLFKRVSLTEKIYFTRNLKTMIEAGVPLPRSLETLSKQTKSKRFKEIVLTLKEEIIKGKNLSDSLSRYKDVFPEIYFNMVKAGEESGRLGEVLEILARQMERQKEMRSKTIGALIYPLVILVFMTLIGILMLVIVVPKMTLVFVEMGVELPATTKMVIFLGETLKKYWYLVLTIIPLIGFVFSQIKKIKSLKKALDKISLKIPIISSLVKKINYAYFARLLSSLISAGVGIVSSLEIISNTLSNFYFKESLKLAVEEVKKGKRLSETFAQNYSRIYSPLLIQMIEVGEETGQTVEILAKLADFYEEEVANETKNISIIIEPLMMIFIGGLVGFFVASMIQPMYSMLGSMAQ